MPEETRLPAGWAAVVLHVLAVCGYGLWMLLGLGLALGIYSEGRGESLVPLLTGAVFVSLGPLLASTGVPWLRGWRGWRLEPGLRPSRQTLLALACYLPMLGVAGLARGSNDFWATRLVSAALAGCSLACLVHAGRGMRVRQAPGLVAQLPVDRVITACYGGGLWLLLCVVSQDPAVRAGETRIWVIGLLLLALLMGLVEGMRWQSISSQGRGAGGRWRRRFTAATLTYAVPCLGLLLVHYRHDDRWPVLLAALACMAGRSIELRLYEGMRSGGEAARPALDG
jgi:hypothetical protein